MSEKAPTHRRHGILLLESCLRTGRDQACGWRNRSRTLLPLVFGVLTLLAALSRLFPTSVNRLILGSPRKALRGACGLISV